jgi:dTDP-4-dehydrorhamnose reductase
MGENNVLVLGDGLLGSELIRQTGWNYLSRRKDGINFNNLETYFKFTYGYDTIINCIAYTEVNSNEKKEHILTNFKSVVTLANYCNQVDKKLVHISTDYVYSNSKPDASEEDIPSNCTNWYTYSKILSDGYIEAFSQKYLLIRTSFKPRPYPHPKATIQVGNFGYVDEIASLIIKLVRGNANGVFNVGLEKSTMFDFASRTREVTMHEKNPVESMPVDISMNITKMKEFLDED